MPRCYAEQLAITFEGITMLDLFAGAFESAKAARDIGKTLVTLRDEALIKERVFELNDTLMNLQQRLLDAQQNQFDLQRKVFELETQLKQTATIDDLKAQYRLATFSNGTRVYTPRDEFMETVEDQYFCTQCFERDGKAITLQEVRSLRKLTCPTCKVVLYYSGKLPTE
ncbi:hypothetical protein DBR45_56700 [Pseudomonas sp. HMWF031]|nr:hypothetical protein DBR45_56700 [Pseudomonas sp. HMWF031]